jgi:hypothetical protein
MIKDLNARSKTLNLLWENFEDVGINNDFQNRILIGWEIKTRIRVWDCIKL